MKKISECNNILDMMVKWRDIIKTGKLRLIKLKLLNWIKMTQKW